MSKSEWGFSTNQKSLFSCELASSLATVTSEEVKLHSACRSITHSDSLKNTLSSVFLIKENNGFMIECVC